LKLDEVLRREKEGLEAALQERAKEHSEIEEAIELLRDNPAERERRRAQQQQKVAELKSLLEEQVMCRFIDVLFPIDFTFPFVRASQTELHSAEANRAQEQVLGALGHIADYKAHVSRSVAEARESYSKREQAIRSIKIDH
jgi:predicted nuclease with TOPRIM domain